MVVVDASVILDLLLQGDDAAALTARLLDPARILAAPQLLDVEVAQTLRRYVRTTDMTPARGRAALEDLADLPIERYPHTLLLPRIWDYRDNLTAYDATYLALADALDCPVWTRDERFAGAPPASGRVQLI
ncbi:MAG: type II toxin-antitoxin system VapC family toxin [Thiohalocapsa sp.]|jgi:predicted nucleic acid-binding protein|uniref:type II toxin-antitoxin system VapC family toxin n=1 Tax=Thiohalocapsa sp. TaxID=2497641 RepID=UPI0025D0BB1A|nr:type II toxin-antitoxin system VapC family toxin [Thiohalocapsa sp.]MCG6940557.1 type II toxin-antitoxin system VapC family toxin [Thiohalocapsa sp.]